MASIDSVIVSVAIVIAIIIVAAFKPLGSGKVRLVQQPFSLLAMAFVSA